jgi:hypothetical protein
MNIHKAADTPVRYNWYLQATGMKLMSAQQITGPPFHCQGQERTEKCFLSLNVTAEPGGVKLKIAR